VSGARGPDARPSLLDIALFPDTLPADAPPAGAGGAPAADDDAAGPRTRWGRGVGAFLFWSVAQSLFILPTRLPQTPGTPVAAWYRPLVPPAWGAVLNVAVAAAFVWWFALRPGARGDARRRAVFRLRALPGAARPWAAGAALLAGVAVNAATLVLPRVTPLPQDRDVVAYYTRLPNGTLALAALAVLVAPLLEEFFFRGWAQGALERRVPAWPAILATAAAFAALHGLDAFGLIPRVALATAAGYAAWSTRSIWPSVALHGAYNASLFVGGAALPALLPRPPRAEAWADVDRAAFFFWAHDPRVFWPALAVLALAVAGVVLALRGMAAAARAHAPAEPDPAEPGLAAGPAAG
jgi:membrane protease YdiL (CAAX protease family)